MRVLSLQFNQALVELEFGVLVFRDEEESEKPRNWETGESEEKLSEQGENQQQNSTHI